MMDQEKAKDVHFKMQTLEAQELRDELKAMLENTLRSMPYCTELLALLEATLGRK